MARQLPQRLEEGTVLDGRYRIDARLGEGGMGEVYRGQHVKVGRTIAIKVLSQVYADHPEVRRRFEREARLASAAGHPGIIEVFDAGELPDGRPYLVMELLRGHELREEIERERPPVDRALRWVRDMARALHAAHGQGVVHRDLKLENIFLIPTPERSTDSGDANALETIKVLDFGIAHGDGCVEPRLTSPGLAMGTPEYMAPEQVRSAPPTPATDIYGLGVILFEVLTGKYPHDGETVHDILEAKLYQDPPSLRELRPEIPEAVEELAAQCLAVDPDARPSSAAEVADRIQAVLVAREHAATTGLQVALQDPPRRISPVWAIPGALAILIGVTAWMFVSEGRSQAPMVLESGLVTPELPGEVASPVLRGLRWPPNMSTTAQEGEGTDSAPPSELVDPSSVQAEPGAKRGAGSRPRSKAASGSACRDVPDRAEDKRRTHDWSGLLKLTRQRGCWTDRTARLRYEVLALKELERFSACARRGRGSSDPEVAQTVRLCEARVEKSRR